MVARAGCIRLLTRLNRLTETNPIEAFSERGSPAHAELVDILHQLASPPVATSGSCLTLRRFAPSTTSAKSAASWQHASPQLAYDVSKHSSAKFLDLRS